MKTEAVAQKSERAAAAAERHGKGIRLDVRFRVYQDGTAFVGVDNGSPMPVNSREEALAWFEQTWDLLCAQAAR